MVLGNRPISVRCTMETMSQFSDGLKTLVSGTGRPFVCDGNPLECRVFLVGANPATEISKSFWYFWNENAGFNKKQWLEQYIADRANTPLKPGRTRRQAISPTRRGLNWISEGASPIKCLETNVFSKPTESLAELEKGDRSTGIFQFLIREISPILVVAHGKDAREYLEAESGGTFLEGILSSSKVFSHDTKILCVSHLSRGWSKIKTRELGNRIKEIVCACGT